ncbi:MAG TPA: hypothetical protein VN599_06935 [Rudaea sp.]|nr:hypothetical protein [Rudaea sp.]
MYREACKFAFVCVFMLVARQGIAQSMTFAPAVPLAGETVVIVFSQPFDCENLQPKLTTSSGNSFTFSSNFPYGPHGCDIIPTPPPPASISTAVLGALSPGTYTVTWNINQEQPSGAATLLSTTSAQLVVASTSAAVSTITPGFTGNWYDPSQSGHGFSLEVLPGNLMLAEWFVFGPYGGQFWIVATGPITGNSAVLQAYYPAGPGGKFPPNFNASQLLTQPWGTIIFNFTGCDTGQVSWQPTPATDGYYTSGSIPIARLTMPAGLSCP